MQSSDTRRRACAKQCLEAGVQFIEQTEQRGTGHAIQCARQAISGYEHILVLSGDVPLIQAETLQHLMTLHLAEGAAMTILTAVPEDPTGYGRIIRRSPDRAEVDAIVEQKALKAEQQIHSRNQLRHLRVQGRPSAEAPG